MFLDLEMPHSSVNERLGWYKGHILIVISDINVIKGVYLQNISKIR